MTSATSRQPVTPPTNRLAGEAIPNTLGGVGLPRSGTTSPRIWTAIAALAGALLAVLAFVLLTSLPA